MGSGKQRIKNFNVDNQFRAQKSLGQNWLRSESAKNEITRAAELQPGDQVLEIGPGLGFLTEALLKKAERVIAVEKDERLIKRLQTKFAPEITSGKLQLLHRDIRELDAESLALGAGEWKLIANIPYYLTGYVLRQWLTAPNQPQSAVLMLQKEVAERIAAKKGKENLLSILVKAFGEPQYIKTVPAGAFQPIPAVDSAILKIKNISRLHFLNPLEEKEFFAILKQGFAQKRKMLKNKLGSKTKFFPTCGINPKARAEDLSLEQWLCLIRKSKSAYTG